MPSMQDSPILLAQVANRSAGYTLPAPGTNHILVSPN